MYSRLPIVLVLLLVTTAVHAQELETTWLEVADVALRLRSGPSTDTDVITQLTPREAVQLLQRGEAWSQVRRQDGQTGWAHNDYLLPWDERNRPDARRRVGEKRLFRVQDAVSKRWFTVNAELGSVSEHAYFYVYLRDNSDHMVLVPALQELGEQFDERVYHQSLEFWGIQDPPDIGGDERVVILIAEGFSDGVINRGEFYGPGPLSDDAGYIAYLPAGYLLPSLSTLAHEFRHMIHHQTGGNPVSWVNEGLATFWEEYLENEGLLDPIRLGTSSITAGVQLNLRQDPDYIISMMFMTYIHERLGLETLREFAARPERGLDALDAVLQGHPEGLDADSFFADWVLTNYLLDTRREGGRYGYLMLDKSDIALPAPSNRIQQYPAGFRDTTRPYSAAWYELPLHDDSDATSQLLLDFRLTAPPPQDAWLQFVQVLPDSIDVQRFRASDFRGRPILASLRKAPQRAFVAISPFTTGARQRTQPVHFSLALRQQPEPEIPQAQVTSVLNFRGAPETGDNILGKLQPCSLVQVLQRNPQWSQVLNGDGLIGWAHNDYLFHLNLSLPGGNANPCAALSRASHDGELTAVQRLLASGADVNASDTFGRTALHEAAIWGHERIIANLLRAGADVHQQDVSGRTPLDEVFHSGDPDSILLLLRAGNGPELSDPAIRPLMINAAASGNHLLLERILAGDHPVDWRDSDGRTALAVAAEHGQDATLGQLLAAGADAQQTDRAGRTPLMLAAARGQTAMLGELLRAGADVNRLDLEGHSALTLAAANGHALSVARLLFTGDADLHHSLPASGRNALHLAAAGGHEDVIAMLRLAGSDPAAQDTRGRTALQLAAAGGHHQTADYLRLPDTWKPVQRLKLSPQERDEFLSAAASGDLAEVERFLTSGAQLLLVSHDEEGLTALMLAARAGHPAVVLRLLLAGADPDERENLGWDEPAIFYTIRDGHDDITAMLLLADAWPGAAQNAAPDTSALFWAAGFGREDVVHLLLGLRGSRQIDVNTRDPSGSTALFYATWSEQETIVRALLSAGADPNIREITGRVPLHFAIGSENRDIVNLLLAAGADPNGGGRHSLLTHCRVTGNQEILAILLAAGAEA